MEIKSKQSKELHPNEVYASSFLLKQPTEKVRQYLSMRIAQQLLPYSPELVQKVLLEMPSYKHLIKELTLLSLLRR